MCYFVEINLPRQELQKRFGIPVKEDPRYMPGVFMSAFNLPFLPVISGENPEVISFKQWGLIPFWTKDENAADKLRKSTFNAKAETIWDKPSFRTAARNRRCIILVHGFFEYHTINNFKIPYYIKRKDDEVFALAGLYDRWKDPSGEIIESCSVITVPANSLLEKIHNVKKRMPAILDINSGKKWINTRLGQEDAGQLLQPYPAGELHAHSISKDIIKLPADSNDEEILTPVTYEQTRELL